LSSGDEARIEKIVRQYSGVFDPCYDLHHLPGEDLGRSVTLKWTLAAGQVTGVQGTSNTIGDLKMVSCMEKMLARWKFPADITGDVSWTFVLSHDGTPAP